MTETSTANAGAANAGAASSGRRAPLSPVLLAGLALRPLPPALLAPVVGLAWRTVRRRYPAVFERLAGLGDATILLDPIDLPFSLLLRPGVPQRAPALLRDGAALEPPGAAVRGPLLALIDLLEGRLDGDALFFSRELAIEGDTELVVALRNAVDSAEIDLVEDLLTVLGPLHGPARRAFALARTLFARAACDLERLRAAAVGPVERRCDRQSLALRELEDKVATLQGEIRRRRAARRDVPGSAGGEAGSP